MHEKTMREDWTKITNIIKMRFKRITDKDINAMEKNIDALSDCLQSVYGFTNEKTAVEYAKIKAILHVATRPHPRKTTNTKKQ